MKKSFIVYHDAMDVLEVLDDSQVANLFRSMISLSKGEDVDIADPLLKAVFIPIKNQMCRDVEKYKIRTEVNRNNGLNGGRPKNPTKPKKPTGFSNNPTEPKKADTVNDNDTVTDKVKVINIFSEVSSKVQDILADPSMPNTTIIHQWLAVGAIPELDIYPTIERINKKSGKTYHPTYYDKPILQAIADRTKKATLPEATFKPERPNSGNRKKF